MELRNFAIEWNGKRLPKDADFRAEFLDLCRSIQKYLKRAVEQSGGRLSQNSIAAKLMRVICNHPEDYTIFSFNYTNLNNIITNLGINTTLNYTHIHGNLDENSIILGFEDQINEIDDFCYMIKTFSPYYSSHKLRAALADAKEVIFFGHSLGCTDYHYFEPFFKAKSNPNLSNEQSTRISIITGDENAKIAILNQLRKMNDNHTDVLFDKNKVNTYSASYYNTQFQIHHLLRRLQLESIAYRNLF